MFEQDDREACNRREDRRMVDLGAVIFRRDGSRSAAELSNLSYGGCGIAGNSSLEPAERIRLVVPTLGEIDAQVRWAAKEGAGAQFASEGCDKSLVPHANAFSFGRHVHFGSGRTFGRKGQTD